MPRTKNSVGISSLIETDSEPDLNSFDAEEIDVRPVVAAKKPRGRPARANPPNRVSKPAARRPTRANTEPSGLSRNGQRQALSEKGNGVLTKKEKASSGAHDREINPIHARRGRPKATRADGLQEETSSIWKAPRGRPPAKSKVTVDVRNNDAENVDEDSDQPMEHQDESIQATQEDDEHPVSLEDTADPVSLRRQLEDVAKKYQNLETRHRDLKEVGVKEAEKTFERLKAQSDESQSTATKLINELRAELLAQRNIAKENSVLQRQLELCEAKISSLSTALTEAKAENKSLSNKLAAARSSEANSAAAAKVPGSALKGKAAASQAAAAASGAVQTAQMKEDLYADLTGLIVRGVKHDDNEHIFDCIQTGRNGTLHFKLALDLDEVGENYADAHYTYSPLLDPNRDEDLVGILPEYLVDEITFKRPFAAAFYTRLIKSLTENID